jgi:hypothetical protein
MRGVLHMQNVLTKEDIMFLKELAIELKTQDRVATAKPVFYQVMEDKRIVGFDPDYSDQLVLLIGDEYDQFTDEELEEAKEFYINHWIDEEDNEKIQEVESASNLEKLKEVIEQHDKTDCTLTAYQDESVYHNAFLTKKACELHISRNGYHYNNPRIYVNHAWRNPELERLLEIVEKFADIEIDK